MSLNLLDLAKSYLNDDIISEVSNQLGETTQATRTALDGALPTVLSGLVQRASEPGGTSSVMDLMAQMMTPNRAAGEVIAPVEGEVINHLGNLAGNGTGGSMSNLLAMGSDVVSSLFGEKAGTITGALASYSGVRTTSASSLLSLAGPVLLSVLGQKMAADDGGPTELGSLMSGQTEYVESSMPSGLASLLNSIPGLSLLGGLGSRLTSTDSPPVDPTPRIPLPVSDVATPAEPFAGSVVPPTPAIPPVVPYSDEADLTTGGSSTRWLPWLLLALGVLAMIYFVRGCGRDARTADDTASATADSVGTTVDNMATDVGAAADSATSGVGAVIDSAGDAIGDAAANLGAFFKRKLPTGYELNIPENGIENNLVRFIEDKNKPVDKETWFNFGRLLFDTGKATLKPGSKDEVGNIAEIMKAYPAVNLKIGGYTDNTGDAALNQRLSQDRADAVVNELVAMGISKSRLEAEGYGSAHPVASNDTEAGRAQNRRIAARVTKK